MKLSKRDFVVGGAAVVGAAALVGEAAADQPHMDKAVEYLQMAKRELQASAHNKGGHRNRAISIIDDAIREVRAGKQAART